MIKDARTDRKANGVVLTALAVFVLIIVAAAHAHAFSLLGNRPKTSPIKWSNNALPFLTYGLTYTIDPGFLGGSAAARAAVAEAFGQWTQAGSDALFVPSRGSSIPATDALINQLGIKTALLNWKFNGTPVTVPIEGNNGLGANVDVFSRPSNFSIYVNGATQTFSPTTLAFTVPIYSGNELVSTDIYFNEGFNWTTNGSGTDIKTVVVHEIGHALALNHPNQAPAGYNYNPVTYAPETYTGGPSGAVMYSGYTGIKTIPTPDDVGGLKFLYGSTHGTPPPKSGVIATNFQMEGGQYFFSSPTIIGSGGAVDLSSPSSPHYNLFTALQQDGLNLSGAGYLLDTGSSTSAVIGSIWPGNANVTIQFDVALLSGPVIDPNAYFAFSIGGMDFFRLNFNSPLVSLFAFDGTEDILLRTNYYHVFIPILSIPGDYLCRLYDAEFRIGHAAGPAGAQGVLRDTMPLQAVPEPTGIFALLLPLAWAARNAVKKFRRPKTPGKC
jgi:hypothetical protein